MIKELIEKKLMEGLHPLYLSIINESHLHAVPKGSETHFKIEVVSSHFENKKLLERHRMVGYFIKDEIDQIKAYSLHTFTPSEWESRKNESTQSPTCVGGSKNKTFSI